MNLNFIDEKMTAVFKFTELRAGLTIVIAEYLTFHLPLYVAYSRASRTFQHEAHKNGSPSTALRTVYTLF